MKRWNLLIGFVCFTTCLTASLQTMAEEGTDLSSTAPASVKPVERTVQSNESPEMEAKIREVAKKRLYPGGMDEEDLKVQAQLYVPELKKGTKKKGTPAGLESHEED